MYKLLDLGFDVPETGERRVTLLGGVLTKTASSEIQKFWDGLERKNDSAYLWVIGVSAKEYYGCNNNGDAFTEADLKNYHHTFVDNAHVFLHHVNKDPNKSIGRPIFSHYNDVMHRVEIVMELSKGNIAAADTISKIKKGEDIYVSMGCNVAFDVCSICGNKAKHRGEYCEHLRYNLKKVLPDGRQVYALNPSPKFFDISIVRRPADPTAFTLDKAASLPGEGGEIISSAELGEIAMRKAEKVAALQKMSDIIKQVDGYITDAKDDSGDTNVLRQIAKRGFSGMEYPDVDMDELSKHKISPLSYAGAMLREGAPLSFGDSLYMAGRHCFGDEFSSRHLSSVMSAIPTAIRALEHSDMDLESVVSDLFSGRHEDVPTTILIKVIRPAAQSRVFMLRKMASDEEIEKIASSIPGVTAPSASAEMHPINRFAYMLSDRVPGNLRTVSTVGADGKTYSTNLGEVRHNALHEVPQILGKKALGAALLTVALGALLADPVKARNLATAIISGAVGANLLASTTTTINTAQVAGTPATTAFHKSANKSEVDFVRAMTTKTAGASAAVTTVAKAAKAPVSKLVYTGMAIPAALGLDYMFNKLKYRDEDPKWHLTGPSLAAHRAGEFVVDNPVLSIGAGGLAGGALRAGLLRKGWLK